MTTQPLSRLLFALTLIAACSKAEAEKSGLPPARPGGAAPTIPGPPPKPGAVAVAGPGAPVPVAQGANSYVATALPKHSAVVVHCERGHRRKVLPPIEPDGCVCEWWQG